MNQNIGMMDNTLKILEKGYYVTESGKRIDLMLTRQQMEECKVYFPEQIERLGKGKKEFPTHSLGQAKVECRNMDSFTLARQKMKDENFLESEEEQRVLVLNFANAVHPGGGARNGANAQEEDLCRKSSLLLSLEGRQAEKYYVYNRSLHTNMGSDAIIYTPKVEMIKDEKGNLLEETIVVSVLTCAAPMLRYGMEGMTHEQYKHLFSKRITGILNVAASLGYKRLILGAFGCGAFRNDSHVVSDLFCRVLKEFEYDGKAAKDLFQRVDFAVLDRTKDQYNFKEFSRNFSNFNWEEETEKRLKVKTLMEQDLDKIRGSLIGGAVGDALGYAVEFWSVDEIVDTFGEKGITSYKLTNGKAIVSDDTQMTLFTANGLLLGDTRGAERGIRSYPRIYVEKAYEDWYQTQTKSFDEVHSKENSYSGVSWILDIPELFMRRAPGTTCLLALANCNRKVADYVQNPVNDSKGCGGLMRVAPVALRYRPTKNFCGEIENLDMEAAQIAAITHGHSLGYMPAAVLSHIITGILLEKENQSLKEIVMEARDTVAKIFTGDSHLEELVHIINLAIELSENEEDDAENIHRLGEGWVAEETLAIAIYCSLKYSTDFSAAVIAAVNHKGDSDSTGAVTGNIVGALVGYERIEKKWKKNLELHDVILEMADDLSREHSCYTDPDWVSKYIDLHRHQKYTLFWNEKEENGWLSNWYLKDFVIDDFKYFCVEQYMMSQKAKLFHDAENYTAILRTDTPQKCKDFGKKVTPFHSEIWNHAAYEIVKTGNRAKFEQNPYLKEKLIATGDSLLAEASPFDKIWGIGLDESQAAGMSSDKWPGKNLLGRILMELREEFRGQKNDIHLS